MSTVDDDLMAQLAAVDVQPLEKLAELSGEIGVLQGRLQAMAERRASVAEAVFLKVQADYQHRLDLLEQSAAPLKQAARSEFARLAGLLERSQADHQSIQLEREEIDFRHSLGEFDQDEYRQRIDALAETLAARAAIVERAQALRQRFVEAFGSEAELQSPPPAAAAAPAEARIAEPAVPRPADFITQPPMSQHATVPPPAAAAFRTAESPALPSRPAPSAETRRMTPISADDLAAAAAPASSFDPLATQAMRVLKGDATQPPRADQTVVIRGARLVPQNPAAGKLTHTVGLKPVVLGSSDGCDIRIAGAAAQHAEIRVSMAGYTLSDLGGGVRINGVAVEQHLLRHDDVVDLGPARFMFREG